MTTVDAGVDQAVADLVAEARPRRRGAWSRRCPCCLSFASLSPLPPPSLAFQCPACERVFRAPRREDDLPAWETAPEIWDAYSRPGRLLEEWGRSTDREDGAPPPAGDEQEHMAPRVRAAAVRGHQDELLDRQVRAYVDQTEGLRDAADTLKRLALRLGEATVEETPRARRRAPSSETPETYHRRPRLQDPSVGEPAAAADPAPAEQLGDELLEVVDVDAHRFTTGRHGKVLRVVDTADDAADPPTTPVWYARLFGACRLAMLWQLAGLYILATNALKKRGVEVDETLDMIHPRTRRSTPYACLRHALAAVYGLDEPAEASPLPRNAEAKFKLPSGVVFGRIACKPTRNYPAAAREPRSDTYDVDDALAAARVGARTYCDGGRIRREPGRPLLDWERALVRLVDAGEERRCAHQSKRTKKVDSLAVERLTLEEALPKLRGYDGAPRTLKQAKIALQAVRQAIRLALEDRDLIPSAGVPAPEEASLPAPADAVAAPRSKRRRARPPQAGAFAGVGVAA